MVVRSSATTTTTSEEYKNASLQLGGIIKGRVEYWRRELANTPI